MRMRGARKEMSTTTYSPRADWCAAASFALRNLYVEWLSWWRCARDSGSWPDRPLLVGPVLRHSEMAGEGFEPSKAEPTRLQRVPFDRSGTPPRVRQFRACKRPMSAGRRAGRRPARRLGRLAQWLGVRERLELFQRPVLDLAHPLTGDVEGAADLLQRARASAHDAVAHLDHLALATR
jgi:hypothetical protein